jgi:hypothetical protein
MRRTTRRPGLVPGLALLLAAAGCTGRPPEPVDPGRAREVLHTALDAWQKGDPGEALQNRSPAILVIDEEWRGGYRLVSYRLEGDQPLGGGLRCRVSLSLKDLRGRAVRKQAVYSVGTSPALTVTRGDDP